MRVKGQCFICKQPNYLAKDCPTQSTIRLNYVQNTKQLSRSININYSVLDKFTGTLEDNNYLDIDLIAHNTMDPSLSTACIYSIAIYIDSLDENYNSDLFKNTHKSFQASYQTILQVFGIERQNLISEQTPDASEHQISFTDAEFKKRQYRIQNSIFSKGKFYRD